MGAGGCAHCVGVIWGQPVPIGYGFREKCHRLSEDGRHPVRGGRWQRCAAVASGVRMPCRRTCLPCLVHACVLSKSPSVPALWQNAAPGTAPPPPPADGKDLDAEFLATGKKSYPASHDLDNIISGGAQAAALPARPLNQDGPYTQGPARRASACALGRWVSSTSCRVVAVPKGLALDVHMCMCSGCQPAGRQPRLVFQPRQRRAPGSSRVSDSFHLQSEQHRL